ncbi:unnamed protein product [Prorocentrum cordatum]|uniref:Uncharacterized protein n=1 Tax=Prorocentrum cordatum TaxID=2364126 RepID=A0ABN9PCI8_9DINO|nr:unnamed protein product [Polarella glacialis]
MVRHTLLSLRPAEGSAQQLAASLHENNGGRPAATRLGHSARAPALQGRLEEASDGAQQVAAWIRGWKVRRPTVAALKSLKQVLEKVMPANRPSGEKPAPEVSVRLQDCECEIPFGTKGLRVRLPGVLELDSLEAVLETIAAVPPCPADAAGQGDAAQGQGGAAARGEAARGEAARGEAARGEAAPAQEGATEPEGSSFRSVQSFGEPSGDCS